MMLIRLPDELFNRVAKISENLGKSIGDYLTNSLSRCDDRLLEGNGPRSLNIEFPLSIARFW